MHNKCSQCGNTNYVVQSNNPLVANLCESCLEKIIDKSSVEYFAFFCRTFNIYFSPDLYMRIYKSNPAHIFTAYIQQLAIEKEKDFNDGAVGDNWKAIQEEWSKILRYDELYAKLDPIKDGFLQRMRVKWGSEFTFAEYIQLENLFINTIKTYGLSDPVRVDAVKKACKISVMIDQMITSGDAKQIKEYAASYQSFLKIAKIEDMGELASETQIKTVSDLYKYLEKNGFQFKFYDNVERDIVDRTINDIKNSIREELVNATGLEQLLEDIKRQYEKKLDEAETDEAIAAISLDELIDDEYDYMESETDKQLAAQDIDSDIEYEEEEF